jgi:hypothetical protein
MSQGVHGAEIMSVKKSERSSLSRRLTNGGADAAKAATDLRARLDRPNLDADTQRSLVGVSFCSNGPVPQKLPWLARDLLGNPPKNATHPQTNSPGHFTVQREKQAFQDWKKSLETDAQAQLSLD